MKGFTTPTKTEPRNKKMVERCRDTTLLVASSSLCIELASSRGHINLEMNVKWAHMLVLTRYLRRYRLELGGSSLRSLCTTAHYTVTLLAAGLPVPTLIVFFFTNEAITKQSSLILSWHNAFNRLCTRLISRKIIDAAKINFTKRMRLLSWRFKASTSLHSKSLWTGKSSSLKY